MTQQSPVTGFRAKRISSSASAIAGLCVRHPLATLYAFVTAALLSALLAAFQLRVDTDPSLMISNDLPAASAYQKFIAQFPVLDDTFLVIIDAEDPETGQRAAGRMANAMAARKDLFSDVFAPGNGPYFQQYGVLYLPVPAVEKLAADIKQMAPLFNAMSLQPDLGGLDDLFKQIAPVAEIGRAPDEVAILLNNMAKTVESAQAGTAQPLDWASIGSTGPAPTQTRWYVFAKPVLDFSALDAAGPPLAEARRLMAEINKSGTAIKAQLTGDAVLDAEEFESVTTGAALAGITSFTLVTLTVLIGLPALLLVVPALALIVLGLLITAGFAALTVGYLNMISVAFAVLFIGLGVDYAVHVVLRFAEQRAKGDEPGDAAIAAVRHTSPALALCTLTTSLAFLTFTLTDFVGMAQLGIISAAGVTIAFLCAITLIPAILSLLPVPRYKLVRKFAEHNDPERRRFWRPGPATRRGVTVALLALAGVSLVLLPQARFDSDPLNLKDPASPGMRALASLEERLSGQIYAVHLVAEPGAAFQEAAEKLKGLPEVASVRTLNDVMPKNQQAKIDALTPLATTLPTEILPSSPMSDEERVDYLKAILASIRQIAEAKDAAAAITGAAAELQGQLERFLADRATTPGASAGLEQALVQRFEPFFTRIRQVVTLEPVTPETIASGFRDRYVTKDGLWRLEVLPKGNMRNADELDRFVAAVTAAERQVTGAPVDIKEAAEVVASAVVLTYGATFAIIIVLLTPVLRRVRDVALVLAPIMMAGFLMVGYTVVTGSAFNFANVIVLPLLLGLGVDSAIHYVMRAKAEAAGEPVSATWTPRAVLISAFTTMGSFGTLWLSSHLGLASMGELLCIAVLFTLLCTLVVLPQLIDWLSPARRQIHG
ncbi:MAG: MMPL family transporter [Pseudomonadota bacterium]